MKIEDFKKYLKERYQNQIDWYDKKAVWNHKVYQVLQWSAIILSVATPILIIIYDGWTRWVAAGIAFLVAIVTSSLKTFKYQENWINYRTTVETLKKEKYYYDANIEGYEKVEDVNYKRALFVERVESLISRENTLWVITHVEKTELADRHKR